MIDWIRKLFIEKKEVFLPFNNRVQQEVREGRDRIPALNNAVAQCLASEKLQNKNILNILDQNKLDIETLFKEKRKLFDTWKLFHIQAKLGLFFIDYYKAQLNELTVDTMNYLNTYKYSEHLNNDFKKNYDKKISHKIWRIEPNSEKMMKDLYSAVDVMLHKNEPQTLYDFFDRFHIPKEKYQSIIDLWFLPPNKLFQTETENIRARDEEYEKKRTQDNASTNKEQNNTIITAANRTEPQEIDKESIIISNESKIGSLERNLVFISYSRKDKRWLEKLKTYLKPFERDGTIKRWDDTEIEAGRKWKPEIENAIKSTKVAILLISEEFLASDFIANNELPPLLHAAETEGATIISLVIRHCNYVENDKISSYQSFNDPQKPLATLSAGKQGEILTNLTKCILNKLKDN